MSGWIKLHRKFTEWEWYKSQEMKNLFLHLLLKANHADGKWQGMDVKRGQLITGLKALNTATGISTQRLRTCLSRLESTGELTSISTNKFRVITLCNYTSYQIEKDDTNKQINKQLTNKQQSTNKQLTSNKNEKKKKNEKKNKNKHLDFVLLSTDENEKLLKELGKEVLKDKIESLNNYIGSTGKKYKSHYHTILNWVKRDNNGTNGQSAKTGSQKQRPADPGTGHDGVTPRRDFIR